MHLIRSALAGLLALLTASSAVAQTFPTVPDRTVIGRLGVGGSSGPSQAIPFATFFANAGFVTLPITSGDVAIFDGATGKIKDGGGGAPWSAQVHQNGGGTNTGRNLMWANQNSDVQADHFTVFSDDQSLLSYFTIGGTKTTGNVLTVSYSLNSVAGSTTYTVQAGDTVATIASNIASCLNGTAVTGGSGCTTFNSAMAAYLGTDGLGYKASASADSNNRIGLDFPWAASGNSLSMAWNGGATATVTAGTNTSLDIGPLYKCARYVNGRTPVSGDEGCAFTFEFNSGPATGIDSRLGFINVFYRGGGVATPYGQIAIGGAAGAVNALPSIFVGPKGVSTAATDGSGNTCGTFTGNTPTTDPGAGNLSVCGQAFLGMQGNTFTPSASSAVESNGWFRVFGSSTAATAGEGIELGYATGGGGVGSILAINRASSTYKTVQFLASAVNSLPNNSTTTATTHDTTGFYPQTDNSLSLGKSSKTWSNVLGVLGTFSTSVTSPLEIGGSGTTGTQLTFKTTTGNGTTDQFAFVGGNNGGTSFATLSATKLALPQTTAASSVSTGALTVAGGLGVAGDLFAATFSSKGANAGLSVDDRNTGASHSWTFYAQAGVFAFFSANGSANRMTLSDTDGSLTSLTSGSSGFAVGPNGATNPAFQIDASTASLAAGLKLTGAATGGTVALAAIDSGSNTNLTINGKGSGTIGIGSVSTGIVTITPELDLVSNAVFTAATKTVVLKRGANGTVGTFVCTSGGTITINNTNVAITDTIIISLNTVGGTISTNPTVNAITASTSFTAKCATSDTSTYNYGIIKNAAWLLERDLRPGNDNSPAFMGKVA